MLDGNPTMDSCSSTCICKHCDVVIIRYRNLIVLETALTIHVAIASGVQVVTPAAYMDFVSHNPGSLPCCSHI